MPVFAVGVMDVDRMARHPYRFSITTIFNIRYSTLSAICRVLDCEVGELLVRAD